MSASTQRSRPRRSAQRKGIQPKNSLPPIVCARCGGPLVLGQNIGPLFSAKVSTWSAHPVLSKPPMLRGVVSTDGSPGRTDLSLGDQLRQRAAMGGEKERADLAAFEALIVKWISDALVAQLREEAAGHGVDVWTLLTRQSDGNANQAGDAQEATRHAAATEPLPESEAAPAISKKEASAKIARLVSHGPGLRRSQRGK